MIDVFYADPHFGHDKIIEYEERPFDDVEAMNAHLIYRYNQEVKPEHTCLWAGDAFLMSFEEAAKIMAQLNGKKWLLLGNHDRSPKRMAALGFTVITGEVVISPTMGGRTVRVSHYPYWTDGADRHGRNKELSPRQIEKYKALCPPRIQGEVLLHGHTHGKRRVHENMINVGVDAWAYGPVPRVEVEALVRKI
jgi:calcineurin-like phosphoesterase family protein